MITPNEEVIKRIVNVENKGEAYGNLKTCYAFVDLRSLDIKPTEKCTYTEKNGHLYVNGRSCSIININACFRNFFDYLSSTEDSVRYVFIIKICQSFRPSNRNNTWMNEV